MGVLINSINPSIISYLNPSTSQLTTNNSYKNNMSIQTVTQQGMSYLMLSNIGFNQIKYAKTTPETLFASLILASNINKMNVFS